MKKKKLKKYEIPILTYEYYIHVYIGNKDLLIREASKYLNIPQENVKKRFGNARGLSYNINPDNAKHPLILIDRDMPWYDCVATLAHEAVHASYYICDYTGIDDNEFQAHTVGAVMRFILKEFNK